MQDTLTADEREAFREVINFGGSFMTALQSWAVSYLQSHPDLEPGFRITDADLASFHASLMEREANLPMATLMRARRSMVFLLGNELAQQAWGDRGSFLRIAASDNQLSRAVELLSAASGQVELFALAGSPLAQAEPAGGGPGEGAGSSR